MPAPIGHNSDLKNFVNRLEHIDEEKQALSEDMKAVYLEAKGAGFNVKALRAIISRRKKDAEELAAHEALVETYRAALGDFASTDLGRAAEPKETRADLS